MSSAQMINAIQLIRNTGLFDSVDAAANIPLARLTLIYAENGRGKTTLAAILRSLATGDPIPIAERQRLAAQHPPHIVLACDGGPPAAMFQNNAWNRTLPNLSIFDDVFVDQNIHSGLAVGAGHRQNLHELILGAQAVALNRQLQQLIARIEEHNTALREKANAIPAAERGNFSVDDFCVLPSRTDVEEAINVSERTLAALQEREPVRTTPLFEPFSIPTFDVAAVERILAEDLPSLDTAAAVQVQTHLARLGAGGEAWASEGMRHIPQPASPVGMADCPFCAQDLGGSQIIAHYREYFGAAYSDLKRRISNTIQEIQRVLADDRPALFERTIRVAIERRQFWSRFTTLPEIAVDTAAIVHDWQDARQGVMAALRGKQSAPLERAALSQETRNALARYEARRLAIVALSSALVGTNQELRTIKERTAVGNTTSVAADVSRLKAVKARHLPAVASVCDAYLAEKAIKALTEQQRDTTRTALENHKTGVFAGYHTSMNVYLQRFAAGFRLENITSSNTRGGPACTYNVVINSTPIAVGGDTVPGQPSFRNTLSSGDRNTLALAFFFSSVDQDPDVQKQDRGH